MAFGWSTEIERYIDPAMRRRFGTGKIKLPGRLPSETGSSAEDLLARVTGGDREAFAEFYDRVAGQVYGLARRVLRDPALAEEVLQEVLVDAWQKAASFDPERGTAHAWILTMAHRRAVDRVRSEQASRLRHLRAFLHEPGGEDAAEAAEASVEQKRVQRALETLSSLQRQAIELAYYGGHTYREVAELLDIPLGTAKTRIRQGLLRLRAALEKGA